MTMAAIDRFESDLLALNACVERAGVALGCCYSTSEEFEAEAVQTYREQHAFARHVMQLRLALGATAAVSLAALLVLTL
jgi:hypothetical protein